MVMGLEAEAVDSLVNEIGRVIPFISIDREHSEIDCVVRDNFKGALLATNHLISKGCKSIICLCPSGPVYEPLHPAYSERIDGFVLGLARSGVTDPMSSVEMVYRSQLSEKLADLINSNKKIDGVLALSRSVGGAFTDMWSVLSKTPCPQVISFDDCREAADVYNGPGQRVSVLVDSLSIAENAVKILVNRIQGSVVGNIRVVVKAELSVEPGEALNSVIA
jgi:DNA-binding LacI/PurR family transcriptional regulator